MNNKGLITLFLATILLSMSAVAAAFGIYTPVAVPKSVTAAAPNCNNGMTMRARECDLLGKRANRQARVVTFSHRRIKKVQQVNLQWKRFFSETLGRTVNLRLSTKGIKTVNKMGNIDEAAKKFDLDLSKF